MNFHKRGILAALLALSFVCAPVRPTVACAPDLAYAILVNGNHPDLPLRLFANGNIGVVQPGWAKSYLVVAFRYLNGKPLSAVEQDSVINLWHTRIQNGSTFSSMGVIDERDAYLTLRSKAIGSDPKRNAELSWNCSQFLFERGIGDASMSQSRQNLADLLKKYKPLSPQIRDWVKAQDGIYGMSQQKGQKDLKDQNDLKTQKVVVPVELPSHADPMLQDYRNYQIGAAYLYLSEYDKALSKFQQLAVHDSPLKQIASYMVLRVKAAKVRLGGKDDSNAVANLLRDEAAHANKVSTRENILNLLRPVEYMNSNSVEAVQLLSRNILRGDDQRFGGDVGDLTFLLDGNPVQPDTAPAISTVSSSSASADTTASDPKHDAKSTEILAAGSDLADWVLSIQNSVFADDNFDDSPEQKAKNKAREQKQAEHSLQMWRKTKSLPWLVAAVSTNGLRGSDKQDLFDAARSVPSNSAAYFTCRFYVADALIASGRKQEARTMLSPLLIAKNLPPSSRNLFTMQMAAASQKTADYLKYAVQDTPEVCQALTDLVSPKFFQVENSKTYVVETPAFNAQVADDINRNAPLSTWMALATSSSIPSKFRSIVLRSAWTRAQLLHRNDQALTISDAMASANPLLRSAVAKYKAAPEGAAKQFAGACVVLKHFGMTPYVQGGLQRHGESIDEFDWYNGNYWVPLPVVKKPKSEEDSWSYETVVFNGSSTMSDRLDGYGENGLASRLTDAEKKQATAERALIFKNNPSRYYGETVLSWAKSHPADPEVPEMLYRIVKLPKWTAESEVGSEYSRKAYTALHTKYSGNKWTRKAVCYY